MSLDPILPGQCFITFVKKIMEYQSFSLEDYSDLKPFSRRRCSDFRSYTAAKLQRLF